MSGTATDTTPTLFRVPQRRSVGGLPAHANDGSIPRRPGTDNDERLCASAALPAPDSRPLADETIVCPSPGSTPPAVGVPSDSSQAAPSESFTRTEQVTLSLRPTGDIFTALQQYQVYNMDVEFDHVYYVGSLPALVHNICNGLANKAIHIFEKAAKKLNWGPFLNAFGGDTLAATAALNAAGEVAAIGAANGVQVYNLVVAGISVSVQMYVENGVAFLSTAWP